LIDEIVFILNMIDKMKLKKEFLDYLEEVKQSCIEAWYETKEEIAEAMYLHINLSYPIPIKKSMIELFLDGEYSPF